MKHAWWTWVFFFLSILLAVPASASDPPTMGEQILLDTGYRYPILEEDGLTPQVLIVDSTIVYLYRDSQRRLVGCRRTIAGEEIDIGIRTIVNGPVGPFSVSGPDSSGWKVVYEDSDEWKSQLWIRDFSARTLGEASEPVQVGGTSLHFSPQIAMGAGFHTIAWIEVVSDVMQLYFRRVDTRMNFLDPEPIPICGVSGDVLALAMGPAGGLVVYYDRGYHLAFRVLGVDGLPSGEPTVLDSGDPWGASAALSRYGSGWLVAWRWDRALKLAFIDSTGAVDLPIYQRATTGGTRTLSACANDSLGIVLWRDGNSGQVFVSLVRRDGGFVTDPILLDDETICMDGDERDPRTAACAWTGDSFAALWLGYVQPVVARGAPTSFWDPFPVFGQWIATDGSLRSAEPVYIAAARDPYHATPIYTGGEYLAFIDDYGDYWTGANRYRAVPLDSLGMPSGAPLAYSLPSVENDCGWDCTFSSTRGVITHPWSGGAAVAHLSDYSFSSEIGTCIDDVDLLVDRIDADRTRTFRHGIPIADGCMPKDELKAYDAAARGDSLLIAWAIGGDHIAFGSLRVLHSSGSVLRNWSIHSDSAVTAIAVAPARKGWISVWNQGAAGGTMRLCKASVDPAVPGNTLTGDWLLPGPFGVPGSPCLVPGPRRIFCIFPAKMEEDYDIYFVRLDSTGTVLNGQPTCLSGLPGDQNSVSGVWDGNHYFVTYRSRDGTDRVTYGNRIGANGERIDGDGFLIANGTGEPARAASDGRGHVMLGWADRLVRIDDLLQIEGDDNATAPGDSIDGGDDDSEPQDSTEVASDPPAVRIAGLLNNPSNGEIRLAGPLPGGGTGSARVMDVNGRVVAIETIRSGADEHPLLWNTRLMDGRRAPTGFYMIRIEAGRAHAIRRVLLIR